MPPDPEPALLSTLFFIVLSLLLVALNGFFVAAEFAIVKVRRTRLQELAGQGVKAARISILCVDELDEYLSATQLGITLVSLALGWIGEESFFGLFHIFFPHLVSEAHPTWHGIALGFSFLVITMLHVVLGELVPKSMAIQRAEKVTLVVARPLRIFHACAKPLIRGFSLLANLTLRCVGFGATEEPPMSEEELKMVMKESHEDGVISESEAQIITRAFEFSDKRAGEIMVPLDRVQFLSLQRSYEENLEVVKERMYTRFPLAEDGFSHVLGVVHMKDVFLKAMHQRGNQTFRSVVRPAVFVDPRLRQDRLLKIFRDQRTHFAIVQDPSTKRNLGVVTLEDVLEELVGDIKDEHGN